MKNKEFYKNIISMLGKNAFENFCSIALTRENRLHCSYDDVKKIKNNVFEISYYNFENPYPHNGKEAYFINYIPINLLSKLESNKILFEELISNLKEYMSLPHVDVDYLDDEYPLINMGIISNVSHMTQDYFFKTLAPA